MPTLNRITHATAHLAYQAPRKQTLASGELAHAGPAESWTPSGQSLPKLSIIQAELPAITEPKPAESNHSGPGAAAVPQVIQMETPPLAKSGVKELVDWGDTLKLVDRHKAAVLVVGFGSKGQYDDPQAAQMQLDQLAESFDADYGKGKWLVVFGGDPYKADSPDVAWMVRHLQDNHAAPVLALQSDKIKEWGGVDAHLDYVHYVPTSYSHTVGADGTVKDSIVWGGIRDGEPLGASAAYLGDDFVGGKNPRLKRMVAIGGGEIAGQEAKYAKEQGVALHYIRAKSKFPVAGGPYGAIDGMVA